jgi:predicted 5'-methylthioadenosine/S-adenosylhomocysteine nucleosidase
MTNSERGILLVAATDLELSGHPGLICGVGPVEAAATTAAYLAGSKPEAVLHVGIAGGRGITPGSVAIGTEAVYADLSAEIPVVERVEADPALLAAVRLAMPGAIALPIATSGTVSTGSATHTYRIEGMEGFGVLRACALAGVPAVEVRAVSNDVGEGDRSRWMIRRALEVLDEAIPKLLAAIESISVPADAAARDVEHARAPTSAPA